MSANCEHRWQRLSPAYTFRYCSKCGTLCLCEKDVHKQGKKFNVTRICRPRTAAEFVSAFFNVGEAEVTWEEMSITIEDNDGN